MYREKSLKATAVLIALVLCAFCAISANTNQQSSEDTLLRRVPDKLFRVVQAQTTKQNGISYAEYAIAEYKPVVMNRMLTELQATGADWVALVVTQYQYEQNATEMYPTVKTATDDDLIYAIDRAHQLGLSVTLKPHVDIANDSSIWRGRIGETFVNAQWEAWFASYTTFINHYAALANAQNVEQFVVGTELAGTSQRAAEWRTVISGVRSLYPNGLLTYSANHSGEENAIAWWDAVDHIGISAYYPIATNAAASLSDLESGWQSIVTELNNLSARTGKSIIFTEVGFRSTDGATMQPWCSDCSGSIDENEQADAYQAFYNVVYNQPWFAGLYWWGWDVDPADSGPCNQDYSPFNKLAENVLRQAHGAASKTLPTDCNNIPPTATPAAIAATATPPAPSTNTSSGFALVDNFSATAVGLLNGQNGWTALGNAGVVADPNDGGNQALRLQGENVIVHHPFPYLIDDSAIATLHYRLLRDSAVDSGAGATEESFPTTFDAFEPQIGVALSQPDAFYARDGGTFKTMSATFAEDSWYCIWLVVDMADNSSALYVKGGNFADVTQLDAAGQLSFQFRNGTADSLRAFYARTGWDGSGGIFFDDIYVDTTGENLASPVTSCQSSVPTPTAVATDTPTAVPTDTPTAVATDTPAAVPTDTPSVTSTDRPTVMTPIPSTVMPTATPTAEPTVILPATPTVILTNTPVVVPSDTPDVVSTNTPEAPAETSTEVPTVVSTEIPVQSATQTPPPPSVRPTSTSTPTVAEESSTDLYLPLVGR